MDRIGDHGRRCGIVFIVDCAWGTVGRCRGRPSAVAMIPQACEAGVDQLERGPIAISRADVHIADRVNRDPVVAGITHGQGEALAAVAQAAAELADIIDYRRVGVGEGGYAFADHQIVAGSEGSFGRKREIDAVIEAIVGERDGGRAGIEDFDVFGVVGDAKGFVGVEHDLVDHNISMRNAAQGGNESRRQYRRQGCRCPG